MEQAPPEQEFEDLPPPPPAPVEETRVGKVLGGPKAASQRPAHLPDYEEVVVIGGPPPPPAPPAPDPAMQQTMADGSMDQTMAAPAAPPPPVPQAPAVDKEIIAQAEAQAAETIAQAQAQAQEQLQQAQMQANQLIEEATAQAQQVAEEARQQAGQQGYQEGMEAGLQEGRQAGQIELQQRIEQLKFQFIDLVKLRRRIMVDMEPEIVKLAWEVAKRVVGDELKSNREVIVGVVRKSLETLNERDEILIRVNPAEYESVKPHQEEFEAMIEGLKKFTIRPDGAIELGSCAIETNLGNVDARIETQFEAILIGLEEMCGIRKFEREDELAAATVEVPGDPEFEQRVKEQAAAPPQEEAGGHGHGGGGEAPPEQASEQAEGQGEPEFDPVAEFHQLQAHLESLQPQLLAEPTDEIMAQLDPNDHQPYLEQYAQQQEHIQQVHARMTELHDYIQQTQGGEASMEQTQVEHAEAPPEMAE